MVRHLINWLLPPSLSHAARPVVSVALVAPLAWLITVSVTLAADNPAAENEAFFESHVRPLLLKHCVSCHGDEVQESKLRLDSRDAILKGGLLGSAATPGKPDESWLWKALRYDGDIQMPPAGKLSDAEIETVRQWIQRGLAWPEGMALKPANVIAEAKQNHWAFQPLSKEPPPAIAADSPLAGWGTGAIDAYVAAQLAEAGLTPSPAADRRTLLRRLSFALWGLPPTAEELNAFVGDPRPDAEVIASWVEKLLASPRYGVRWGRHWLDIARYADTKGYVFTQEPRYPYAYTYRDYVIAALNADLPYDQFVREQLAADHFPRADGDNRSLAALGFLTVGRRFSNNKNDIIDDRIDVVSRGLLGLTVTCARCHDHKYDPIPTADYYSLYGVFASCEEPAEPPLVGQPDDTPEYRAFKAELTKLQEAHDAYRDNAYARLLSELRTQAGDYFLAAIRTPGDSASGRDQPELSLSPGELRPSVINRWKVFLQRQPANDPVFGLWQQLKGVADDAFAGRLDKALGTPPLKLVEPLQDAIAAKRPANRDELAMLYARLLQRAAQSLEPGLGCGCSIASTAMSVAGETLEPIKALLSGEAAPCYVDLDEGTRIFDRATKTKVAELLRKVDSFRVNSPAAPPRAMVLVDAAKPVQPRILVRGNPGRPGDSVPRQFLSVLSPEDRQPFQQGSGRAELATAITSPDNAIFARVIVNRIWSQHFGEGLVRTASDFGARSDPPSHPELLDYLSRRLIESGWSLKNLHREILLSATYQQQSEQRDACSQKDPENRLLWKWNRQRLEYEPLRDAMLAASGSLNEQFGGRSIDLFKTPYTARRTVYGHIDRQELPAVFRVFDVASPDATSPGRPETTVAQQALYLLNSPFVMEQAQRLAARSATPEISASERLDRLYQWTLGRLPDEDERQLSLAFVAQAAAGKIDPWARLSQALLCSNEFVFVD